MPGRWSRIHHISAGGDWRSTMLRSDLHLLCLLSALGIKLSPSFLVSRELLVCFTFAVPQSH